MKEGIRILIRIKQSPEQRFLVELFEKTVIQEIKDLVYRGNHSKAIVKAMLNSNHLREVDERELPNIQVNLVLTQEHSYFDIA